jgi:hypothetical protein
MTFCFKVKVHDCPGHISSLALGSCYVMVKALNLDLQFLDVEPRLLFTCSLTLKSYYLLLSLFIWRMKLIQLALSHSDEKMHLIGTHHNLLFYFEGTGSLGIREMASQGKHELIKWEANVQSIKNGG